MTGQTKSKKPEGAAKNDAHRLRVTTSRLKLCRSAAAKVRSESPGYFSQSGSDSSDNASLEGATAVLADDDVSSSSGSCRTPPRPPPPKQYARALPPPVPKKTAKVAPASNAQTSTSATKAPSGHLPGGKRTLAPDPPKPKPLQRVQPLQIQSPSMMSVLKSKNSQSAKCNRPRSYDLVAEDGLFVSSFCKAFVSSDRILSDNLQPLENKPTLDQSEKNESGDGTGDAVGNIQRLLLVDSMATRLLDWQSPPDHGLAVSSDNPADPTPFSSKLKGEISRRLSQLSVGSLEKISNWLNSSVRPDHHQADTEPTTALLLEHLDAENILKNCIAEVAPPTALVKKKTTLSSLVTKNLAVVGATENPAVDISDEAPSPAYLSSSPKLDPFQHEGTTVAVGSQEARAKISEKQIAPKRPVPSPRTKRKARILMEHKEFGKDALVKLKNSPSNQRASENSCDEQKMCRDQIDTFKDLDDLCIQSLTIGKELERCSLSHVPTLKVGECTAAYIAPLSRPLSDDNQVFLRSGVLAHLNDERDEKVTDRIIRLQTMCRGYLARKNLMKLKTQDIAIRCIQKNVRKFMGVREWQWWRLLIKISPMLNVHRTEDLLKARTEELTALKARLEKVEKERNEFKQSNDVLESRLSEMTTELAEERAAGTLATERLEAEQSERMKLEKDRQDLQGRSNQLQRANERMEMELMYSRGLNMNGSVDHGNEDDLGEQQQPSVLRQKYDRAVKELDYTKKRMQQQHEYDLDQLMALKKQLEKKLNDAYEEVDEQRQVVAQWKRKTQKAQGEMNDIRLLLEEQTSRNVLLEKKQRKFDSELSMLHDDLRQEGFQKDKYIKELDATKAAKLQLEDQVQAMKLDLEYKEEKISALNKELEELHTGTGVSDEEAASLKRQRNDLEARLKDQEEELDDLAGQVQMLEQAKIKLEMSLAAMKKEHRRELGMKDEELEETRMSAQKKVKALEQQLESEHEERINFMREKHELESKVMNLQELASRSVDDDQVYKLRKDLKRTKALLKDAQLMIERNRSESSNKVLLRQLKNQLEDAEFARMAAVKAKQNVELEVSDIQQQLDDALRNKSDLEDRMLRISRERADLSGQLEDNEEELQEVMKKYKASVSQLSVDQITIQQQAGHISDLEDERNKLKEQLAEMSQKIESLEGENVSNAHQQRLELKIKELETKLELEHTTRGRLETQINRLKEAVEKLNSECDALRLKEASSQDHARKLQRQLRDLKEDYASMQQKEIEVSSKKNEFEKKLELAEAETVTARNDLKLALKRVEDLQHAINGELDSESDSINSDADSDTSDEGLDNFMEHHRRACSVQRERESMARESSVQRDVRASIARESVTRQLATMPEEPELKWSGESTNHHNEGAKVELNESQA